MTKGRLEAFSDAVLAVIITIMVLEMRPRTLRTGPRWHRFVMSSLRMSSASSTSASIWIAQHGKDSDLAVALGSDVQGKLSLALYAAAIPLVYVHPLISCGLYGLVAIMWLVPDTRIERHLANHNP